MRSNLEIVLMLFPELRVAIADIAAFMDDDEDSEFDAARQRAVDAYRNELLQQFSFWHLMDFLGYCVS
jgi:hypothetical protein